MNMTGDSIRDIIVSPMKQTASPSPREVTIFQILSEEIDWNVLDQILGAIEDFVQDSSIYYDQAQYALSRKKEKELIDIFYSEVLKLDCLIGTLEI